MLNYFNVLLPILSPFLADDIISALPTRAHGAPLLQITYRAIEKYLTVIPRARMGSESTAHEAEGKL